MEYLLDDGSTIVYCMWSKKRPNNIPKIVGQFGHPARGYDFSYVLITPIAIAKGKVKLLYLLFK